MISVLLIRDVGTITIAKFLSKAKVNDVDEVWAMAGAHNKVGGLGVAVDASFPPAHRACG